MIAPGTPPAGPSPRQQEAAKLREQLGSIVDVLMAGEPRNPSSPMKRMGAALMASHLGCEMPPLSREQKRDPDAIAAREFATKWAFGPEAGALSPAELHKYAAAFRSKFPGAWGAANRCDVANFVRHIKVARLRGFPGDDTVEAMIVSYQGRMSILGAPPAQG